MQRPIERADIRAAYDRYATAATRLFNKRGAHPPTLLLGKVHPEKAGSFAYFTLMPPELTLEMCDGDEGQMALMEFVRRMLHGRYTIPLPPSVSSDLGPDIAVVINEAWTVTRVVPRDAAVAELEALRQGCSASEHPDREEALLVVVHTREASYIGSCPIRSVGSERRADVAPLILDNCTATGPMTMNPGAHPVRQ